MHLKGAVSKHGGRTTPFMSMKGVTHVIAENLSAVKTDKAMKVPYLLFNASRTSSCATSNPTFFIVPKAWLVLLCFLRVPYVDVTLQ